VTFPAELTDLHQWMVWRNEIPPGGGKPSKMPYQPTGLPAKSNDPATWYSYEECEAAVDSFAGVAFVFSELDPYCGIDLDDCVVNGEIEPWAQEIIGKFSGRCYAEISPSGCGVKLIVIGSRDNAKHRNKVGKVECYDRARFWTMTGFVLDGETTIGDAQDAIDWLGDEYLRRPVVDRKPAPVRQVGIDDEQKLRRASAYLSTVDPAISGAGGDHQTFVAACRMLIGFDLTPEQAFGLLWNEYNPRCVPEWTEAELWHKVRQAEKQGGQRGELLTEASGPDISGLLNPTQAPEPPKPPRKKAVETIPEQCLRPPGILSSIIDYTLRTSIYPQPELALAGAIALLATITGRKLTDSYGTRTNVYVLGLAPSGSGKEQARKTNKTLLQLAGASTMIGNERLGSSAGLITAIDTSPAILIQIDEIGRLLLTMKHPEKSPHLYNIGTVLMQLYACSDALWIGDAYADAKRVKRINQPHAVLYGTAPPEGFWESLTAENVTDGLLGRVLAIQSATGYSDPQKPERCDPPSGLLDAIKWWVNYRPGGNMQDAGGEIAAPSPLCVEYSDEASQRFDDHMLAISNRRKDDDQRAAAIWSRSAGKAGKLALIFAASRCPCTPLFRVEREDVDRGIALANFLTRQTLRQVGEHVSDNHWEASTKRVLRLLDRPLTKSQLTKKTQWLKKRERDDILTTLMDSKQVEVTTRDTGGRVQETVFSRQEFKD
jgi:hypothetical protein